MAPEYALNRYLDDWRELPLPEITPQMCRERHDRILRDVKARALKAQLERDRQKAQRENELAKKQVEREREKARPDAAREKAKFKAAQQVQPKSHPPTGARAANQTLRDLRAVWNRAAKVFRDLPPNPVHAVREARERAEHHQIQPEDLTHWFETIEKLPSPLRRVMHELGLFSGLRPGNLVAIEREWIRLERRAISFPAAVMKGRRVFDLPLSEHLCELIRKALQIGDLLYPATSYLFPARSRDGERVIATQTWKEDLLPNATGHALRHTYSNMAALARIDEVSRQMLMAQKIPGIKGRYLDEATLFGRLLEDQERVSRQILSAARF